MNPKYLDSSRRELSNGGLRIVVTLLVRRGIDFVCVSTGGSTQLYYVCKSNSCLHTKCLYFLKKSLFHASYHLHTRTLDYQAHAHQLDFFKN